MLPCFSALRLGRCRGRVRFAVLPSAPRNGVTSKLFPSVVETATGLAGSTLSNSMTGLSRISANEFPCRTSILIISGDSLYIHCITVQAPIFYPNIRSRGDPNGLFFAGRHHESVSEEDSLSSDDSCAVAGVDSAQIGQPAARPFRPASSPVNQPKDRQSKIAISAYSVPRTPVHRRESHDEFATP